MGSFSDMSSADEAAAAAKKAEDAALAARRALEEEIERLGIDPATGQKTPAQLAREAVDALAEKERRAHAREEAGKVQINPNRIADERAILAAPASDAPISENVPLLNAPMLKAIGEEMRKAGKPFLSNEEIDEMAAAIQEAKSGKKVGAKGVTTDAALTATLADEVRAEATVTPAGTTTDTHETLRTRAAGRTDLVEGADAAAGLGTTIGAAGAATALAAAVVGGFGADGSDHRRVGSFNDRVNGLNVMEHYNRWMTEGDDREAREALHSRARAAAMNISDKGDAIAAARLLDKLEHNASSTQIAAAILELETAKRAEDVTIKLRRSGKTIEIVNDGDGSLEISVSSAEASESYSLPAEDVYMSSSSSSQSLSMGGRRPMRAAARMMQAVYNPQDNAGLKTLALFSEPSQQQQAAPMMLLTGGSNVFDDPFRIAAMETPPQQQDPMRALERLARSLA